MGKRYYCMGCLYYWNNGIKNDLCRARKHTKIDRFATPIKKEKHVWYGNCATINKNNDCKEYVYKRSWLISLGISLIIGGAIKCLLNTLL